MTVVSRDPARPFTLVPSRVLRRRRVRRGVDGWLVGAALLLALIGAVLVWSATRQRLSDEGRDPQGYLYRHLANIGIGLTLAVLAARVDVRRLRIIGPVLYGASLLGLLAVFAFGRTINGAHAWLALPGGMQLQPAEFMKLGVIVGMATLFAERAAKRHSERPTTLDVLIAIVLITVPLLLIMLQPDLGSAMVLAAHTSSRASSKAPGSSGTT